MATQQEIKNDPNYIPVLDHGFVGLVPQEVEVTVDDQLLFTMPSGAMITLEAGTKIRGTMPSIMGNDSSIVQAARVSYGRGTKKKSEDRGLIRYLMRHLHTTPFEMVEVKFHIKQPIFVARQWVRHRTANINEYSGRYSIMPDEFYIPSPESIKPQSQSNKQGRDGDFNQKEIAYCIQQFKEASEKNFAKYLDLMCELSENNLGPLSSLLGSKQRLSKGVARELARIVLPLNNYTEFYWKIDLHNLFHFLELRMDHHAQDEIRFFANAIYDLVKPHVPIAAEAFEDYRLNGSRISSMETELLKRLIEHNSYLEINDEKDVCDELGLSARELREFKAKWNL